MLRLHAASNEPGVTIVLEPGLNANTPNPDYEAEGNALQQLLSVQLPSGTYDALMRVFCHHEVMTYQRRGEWDKAAAFMRVHRIFCDRTE
jgi:hypothetical protein